VLTSDRFRDDNYQVDAQLVRVRQYTCHWSKGSSRTYSQMLSPVSPGSDGAAIHRNKGYRWIGALLYLAHTDEKKHSRNIPTILSTNGGVLVGHAPAEIYPDNYHREMRSEGPRTLPGSDISLELNVPRAMLKEFFD